MSDAFQFVAIGALPIQQKITANTATTIVDGTNNAVIVPWFEVNENAGATPNLTVDIYDGTNTFYPGSDGLDGNTATTFRAKAVTANQSVRFSAGYVIQKGSKLRVTSSDAAGKFDVIGLRQVVQQ